MWKRTEVFMGNDWRELPRETATGEASVMDEDDVEAIPVCSFCFDNVHMSMFGIVDEFCSGKCKDAWQEWWMAANTAPQS